jgi:transcriptional regulator with XRE-family HTH domain
MQFQDAIAATLRAERAARKLSMDKLAELSGVSRATIVRLESGTRHGDLVQFYKIATAMGMTGSELLRRAEQRQAEGDAPPSEQRAAAALITERLRQRESDGHQLGRITQTEDMRSGSRRRKP